MGWAPKCDKFFEFVLGVRELDLRIKILTSKLQL